MSMYAGAEHGMRHQLHGYLAGLSILPGLHHCHNQCHRHCHHHHHYCHHNHHGHYHLPDDDEHDDVKLGSR